MVKAKAGELSELDNAAVQLPVRVDEVDVPPPHALSIALLTSSTIIRRSFTVNSPSLAIAPAGTPTGAKPWTISLKIRYARKMKGF